MIAPLYPTLSCCGARATASNIVGHKCSGRGGNAARLGGPAAGNGGTVHGMAPESTGGQRRERSHPAPSRPGKLAEDALCAALVAAGHEVITFREWLWRAMAGTRFLGFVREFNVGALLVEPRRFRCDLLHPSSRTCLEIEGGAHGVQRQRKADILREQLIEAAGLRVVRVLPEQVRDGSAVGLVKSALAARKEA